MNAQATTPVRPLDGLLSAPIRPRALCYSRARRALPLLRAMWGDVACVVLFVSGFVSGSGAAGRWEEGRMVRRVVALVALG